MIVIKDKVWSFIKLSCISVSIILIVMLYASANEASLCGSVGKDLVYHACGHEFKSRMIWNFLNFLLRLWLLFSDYWGMAKCFGAHYNHVRFSSAVKTWLQVRWLIKDEIIIIIIVNTSAELFLKLSMTIIRAYNAGNIFDLSTLPNWWAAEYIAYLIFPSNF